MTKSLITLIGALVSIAIVALAVVFGVLPLAGQALTAQGSTAQAAATNATYQSQITELQKQKSRKSDIDASVAALRAQIPAVPDLDRAFDVIAGSAQNVGATIKSITRDDVAAFVAPPAQVPAGPAAAAEQKALPTPQPSAASGPVPSANSTANQANSNAAHTSQAAGSASPAAPAAPAPTGSTRQQIPIAVIATAPSMDAMQAFLDGLRGSDRVLGFKTVAVTGGTDGVEVRVDLYAFVSPDLASTGASN